MTDPSWPDPPHLALADTLETLHLWTQMAGKAQLATMPWLNEAWHVPLYVDAGGLTTGLLTVGDVALDIRFDPLHGALRVRTSAGGDADVPLEPQSVGSFCAAFRGALERVGTPIAISPLPSEIERAMVDPAARKANACSVWVNVRSITMNVLVETGPASAIG